MLATSPFGNDNQPDTFFYLVTHISCSLSNIPYDLEENLILKYYYNFRTFWSFCLLS